jgi:hypothetical protein
MVVFMLFLFCGMVYAEGSQEKIKRVDEEFAAKTWTSREDWLYDANQTVAMIMTNKNSAIQYFNQGNFGMANFYIPDFDAGCYRYQKILDAGVSKGYITNAVKEEQSQKLSAYREEVNAAVRRASGGLGIE